MRALLTILTVLTAVAPLTAAHAQDEPFHFIFPVSCTPEVNCWIANYVDVNPTALVRDYTCGGRSFNDHKGTDIALASLNDVEKGVDVLAAADGRVLRFRDGETDIPKTEQEIARIKEEKKDCGNGILIDHGNGVRTMYCHLKMGSVYVEKDEQVKAGQKIAQVGHSGTAKFPHLHFGVLKDGAVIDPYSGTTDSGGCEAGKAPLWNNVDIINYKPTSLYSFGFSDHVPDFKSIIVGEGPKEFDKTRDTLVLWIGLYGAQKDLNITMKITGPDKQVFALRNITQKTHQDRQFYYTGWEKTGHKLKSGTYTAEVTLRKAGYDNIKATKEINIP